MTRWGALGIFALALLAFAPSAQASWGELAGGPHPFQDGSGDPSITSVGGVLYVAWSSHNGTNSEVHVSRLSADATAWTDVGTALNHTAGADASAPSIATVGGVPYVAWLETAGTTVKARVSMLNGTGTGWTEVVGGVNPINRDSARPAYGVSIADVGGTPYLAWSEEVGDNVNKAQVWVDKLNAAGTAWTAVGGVNPLNHNSDQQALQPSLTAIGGLPYVAWQEGYGDPKIHVSRLNDAGTGWIERGTGAAPINHDPNKSAYNPDLIGIGGVPYVTWQEDDGSSFQVRVSKYDNGTDTWTEVVGGAHPINLAAGVTAQQPTLASIDGVPYVARSEYDTIEGNAEIRVSRLNDAGTAWAEVDGGVSPINEDPAHDGTSPDLIASGGAPYVTWSQFESTSSGVRASFNDLAGIRFASPDYSVTEGDGTATITVKRSGDAGQATIHYETSNGTATSPGDYSATSGTLTFATGESSKTFTIPIADDSNSEPNETVDLTLSAPGGLGSLGSPATATLTIADNDALDTQILGGPSGATNSASATFLLIATPGAGATFECSLDNAPFAACTSSVILSGLAQGTHQFKARAMNATETDSSPATRTFFVDTQAPTSSVQLASGNGGSQLPGDSRYAGAVLATATATDPAPASGVAVTRCALDPPSVPAQFIEMPVCSAAKSTAAPGVHTFYAASQDLAGNVEPVVVEKTFTIVPTPDTTITSGPTGVSSSVPTFMFTSSIISSTFECRIDSGPFTPCSSSNLKPFKPYGLALGDHTLLVRATSPEGIVDPSPASYPFTLGEQRSNSQCSFRIPYGGSQKYCVAKRAICPLGSTCTRVGEVDVFQDDGDYSYEGIVSYAASELGVGGSPSQPGNVDVGCAAPPRRETSLTRCPRTLTDTVIGKGQAFATICGIYNSFGGQNASRGPDDARGLTCKADFTVRPATALEAGATGPIVSIVVPGPGSLGVGPPGGQPRILAAAGRKGKPAFKPITREVAGEGVEDLTLKLVGKAKKKLKKQHRLELTLDISFTPTEGESISRTQKVVLTSRCKPTKKHRVC